LESTWLLASHFFFWQKRGRAKGAPAKQTPVVQVERTEIKQQTAALLGTEPREANGDTAIIINES
jgi:hypothetical protein